MLDGMAAHARGAVDLAAGEPRTALVALRRAAEVWQDLGAPYEAACARAHALACRALGDDDGASFELEAACEVFERLGAAPDVAWAESLARPAAADDHGLTHRELEVLRMVATGKSQPRDRLRARDQRAHRRAPRAEHLPETARLVADGRRRVRFRARLDLNRAAYLEFTTPAPARSG